MKAAAGAEAKIVDELGRIEGELQKAAAAAAVVAAKLQPKYARAAVLRAILLAACAKTPDGEQVVMPGKQFDAIVSPCEIRRSMAEPVKIFNKIGKSRFLNACTVTLAALKRVATPADFAALVSQARTGPRTLKIVARGVQERAKAA
jgi:hypothetical protein